MTRNTFLILGLCVTMMMACMSCSEDIEESDVSLLLKLQFNDEPLYAGQEIDYAIGYPVFFTKYSFYLSDIVLTSPEGDHMLSNVEFVDLLAGKADQESAERGTPLSYSGVPARQYTGITFNIGLPSNVNATSPNEYDATSPLSNTGEYWEGWSSYIFHKIEGRIDAPSDPASFETALALHIGSDAAFRPISISTPFDIDSNTETINITFDLGEALSINGAMFDLMETPQVHHLGVLPKVLPILDNMQNSISAQ